MIAALLIAAAGPAIKVDLSEVKPNERANDIRETTLARAAYDPKATLINRRLFPVRSEMVTISSPPGLKPYRDMGTRKDFTDIIGMVYKPHDWLPSDRRPVTVYAYGSGWRGYQTGRVQAGGEEAAYLARNGGMVVVSTHYRPGLEKSMADGVSAVRWTRQHADELGIAPDRVTGGGGSSGGHIMLSTSVISDGPENPWDDPGIPKACQYHFGQVAVPSRPKHPALSPAHNLRDGLPPYLQVIGTADKAWGHFAYEFKTNATGKDFPFWFMEYTGGGHGWLGPGHYRVKRQISDFLHSYGAMDVIHYGLPDMEIDLAEMADFFRWQGLDGAVTFEVDGGGRMDGSVFVDDGEPGMSIVTVSSQQRPEIRRHAYLAVGTRLWAEDAEQTGNWGGKSVLGHQVLTSTDDDASLTMRTTLPPGEWMAYVVRQEPYFVHTGTTFMIEGASSPATATRNLAQINTAMDIPVLPFTMSEPGEIRLTMSRGPWDDSAKRPSRNRKLPIAAWAVVVLPRYTGGESGLPYQRGHLRYETFPLGASADGDNAIGQ
jgi:hypothetical protein